MGIQLKDKNGNNITPIVLNTDVRTATGEQIKATEVSVSATGTSTDEVKYITIDGVEKKIGGANYTAGNGIDITSNAVSVKNDGDSISVSSTGIKVKNATPDFTTADANKILGINAAGTAIEWKTLSTYDGEVE